jgi:acetolactate synthase small subunit
MNLVKLMLDKKKNKVYLEVTLSPQEKSKYFEIASMATEPEGKLIDISLNSMFVELGGEDDK